MASWLVVQCPLHLPHSRELLSSDSSRAPPHPDGRRRRLIATWLHRTLVAAEFRSSRSPRRSPTSPGNPFALTAGRAGAWTGPSRPFLRCQVQGLPLGVQRPDPHPLARPRIISSSAGGPGNRNDPVHFRGSPVAAQCQEHQRVLAGGGYRGVCSLRVPILQGAVSFATALATSPPPPRSWSSTSSNWRVLRDHHRLGRHLSLTLAAVAFLHDLMLDFGKILGLQLAALGGGGSGRARGRSPSTRWGANAITSEGATRSAANSNTAECGAIRLRTSRPPASIWPPAAILNPSGAESAHTCANHSRFLHKMSQGARMSLSIGVIRHE